MTLALVSDIIDRLESFLDAFLRDSLRTTAPFDLLGLLKIHLPSPPTLCIFNAGTCADARTM